MILYKYRPQILFIPNSFAVHGQLQKHKINPFSSKKKKKKKKKSHLWKYDLPALVQVHYLMQD